MKSQTIIIAVIALASFAPWHADAIAVGGFDYDACNAECNGYNASYNDPDEILRAAELWDNVDVATNACNGGDYSGFLANPNELHLVIAVPILYEGDSTEIEFVNTHSQDADMESPLDTDVWWVQTNQTWDDGTSDSVAGVIDPDYGDFQADANCFTVYEMIMDWGTFASLPCLNTTTNSPCYTDGTSNHLVRNVYSNYNTSGPGTGGGTGPAGAFIEFCSELKVVMFEEFVDVGPFELTIERIVEDRFIFCIVFQTQVDVAANITIFDAPDYFQLLQAQIVAQLNPDNDTCSADITTNIVTLTQWPYMLQHAGSDTWINGTDPTFMDGATGENTCEVGGAPDQPNAWNYLVTTPDDNMESDEDGDSVLDCQDVAAPADPSTVDCRQDWGAAFCNVCCEGDGSIDLAFEAICRPAVTDCPLASNVSFSGTVILDTAPFCAVLIEAVDVAGTLEAHNANSVLGAQETNYVTGATVYYKGAFTASSDGGQAPTICGIIPMSVTALSFSTTVTFNQVLWSGTANLDADSTTEYGDVTGAVDAAMWSGDTDECDACFTAGTCLANCHARQWTGFGPPYVYPDNNSASCSGGVCGNIYGATAAGWTATDPANGLDTMMYHMDRAGFEQDALDAAPNDSDGVVGQTNLIAFKYKLGNILAPTTHGSYILETTLLVNVFFCDTEETKLLELVYDYKLRNYANNGMDHLLQLQDTPQNLMETANEVGIFDPFPDEEIVVSSEVETAPSNEVIGEVNPVVGEEAVAGGETEIWPIVAGVVGGVTICIIFMIIALRRRQNKKKEKTVAVVPTRSDYGQVAVAVPTEAESTDADASA